MFCGQSLDKVPHQENWNFWFAQLFSNNKDIKAKIKKLTATTDAPNLGNDTPFTLNESFYQKGLLEKILRTTNTITVLSLQF